MRRRICGMRRREPSANFSVLSFPPGWLLFGHADLRVSLREVRERQRNPGAFEPLGGDTMPVLRLDEAGEEVFHICGQQCGRKHRCRACLFRRAEILRHVRHGQTAPALASGGRSGGQWAIRVSRGLETIRQNDKSVMNRSHMVHLNTVCLAGQNAMNAS